MILLSHRHKNQSNPILLFYAVHLACFEWNLHTQISGGDAILSTMICGDHIVDTMFCSMTHYGITIGNHIVLRMSIVTS